MYNNNNHHHFNLELNLLFVYVQEQIQVAVADYKKAINLDCVVICDKENYLGEET